MGILQIPLAHCLAAFTCAQTLPDQNVDLILDEENVPVAHGRIDTAGMTTAGPHSPRVGIGGIADAGRIIELRILANAAFDHIRLIAVGTDVGHEAGAAAPPAEA